MEVKGNIEHTPDGYLKNRTRRKNFTPDKFCGGKVGRSLKHFNNIPITTTPTKRKMEEEKENGGTVKTLIDIFNESTYSSQPESGTAESPAKQWRWGQWGEGH